MFLHQYSNNSNSNLLDTTNDLQSISNWQEKLSLSDLTVAEIIETYKDDTDLLKHVLAAKTEEDKRRGAEEIRRAEEARLHSKMIDLQIEENRRRSSLLDDTSTTLGLSSNDWLSQVHSNDLLSPTFINNTPPSPSQLQPLSPYTMFDVPFAELNLSAPSSPEPNNNPPPPPMMVEKISLSDEQQPPPLPPHASRDKVNDDFGSHPSPPPLPPPPTMQVRERASCKRTLSRTRSTRKPSIKVLSKKNRYQQPSTVNKDEAKEEVESVKEELPLDHDKVMEALRAKLQRSTQQQKEQRNVKEEITSMSPSGILLLDLKNPKKSFPIRPKATPRASVVRKPNSFISAHKPKEQLL